MVLRCLNKHLLKPITDSGLPIHADDFTQTLERKRRTGITKRFQQISNVHSIAVRITAAMYSSWWLRMGLSHTHTLAKFSQSCLMYRLNLYLCCARLEGRPSYRNWYFPCFPLSLSYRTQELYLQIGQHRVFRNPDWGPLIIHYYIPSTFVFCNICSETPSLNKLRANFVTSLQTKFSLSYPCFCSVSSSIPSNPKFYSITVHRKHPRSCFSFIVVAVVYMADLQLL